MNMRNLLVAVAFSTLAACGGGGGRRHGRAGIRRIRSRPRVPRPRRWSPPRRPRPPRISSLAARLYKGDERTPAGFDVEARPANVAGTLSTRHLKNTDFATGPQAHQPDLRGLHQRHGAGHRLVGAPGHLAGPVFGSRRSPRRRAHVRSRARAARRRDRDASSSRVPLRLPGSLEHATCAPTSAPPAA